jgi:hypothetical protein
MPNKNVNIIILERQFNHCLKSLMAEALTAKGLLTEGDSRIKNIRTKIMPLCFGRLLDLDGRVSSPEYYVYDNPNTTWGDYLLYNLRHSFSLMDNSDVPILQFIAPIAWGDEVGFDKRNDNAEEVGNLVQICQLFKQEPNLFLKARSSEYNTYKKLKEFCDPILQQLKADADERMNNANYTANNQYTILRDINYEKAHEIGKYSSLQDSSTRLCYTQSQSIWNSWTKDGFYTAFVCLKNGWQDMKPETGPDAPYDEYGLSMIFVFTNEKGELVASNTRWNHQNANGNSVDHAFTEEQLSNILGMRFKDAFKPISDEELDARKAKKYLAITERFMKSDERSHIKGETQLVDFNWMFNIYNPQTGELASPRKWYKNCNRISDDEDESKRYFAMKGDDDLLDLYDPNGKLIKDKIPGYIAGMKFSLGAVRLCWEEERYNYLTKEGQYLFPDIFFDFAKEFDESTGFAVVYKDGKKNYATPQGTLLFEEWPDYIDPMENESRKIFKTSYKNGNEWTYSLCDGTTGEKFLPYMLDNVTIDDNVNFAIIGKDDKSNILNLHTLQLLSPNKWFDTIIFTGNGVGIADNGYYKRIDKETLTNPQTWQQFS